MQRASLLSLAWLADHANGNGYMLVVYERQQSSIGESKHGFLLL